MRRRRLRNQRGQALLVVLAFVAALMVVVWAGLFLASGAFLSQGSVRADTRNTYALDAGLAFGIQLQDSKTKGVGCTTDPPATLVLPYASGSISVTVTVTPVVGCKTGKPSYQVNVQPGAGRQLNAQISSSNAGKKASWVIDWEAYQ
jgi:hypothetical protein